MTSPARLTRAAVTNPHADGAASTASATAVATISPSAAASAPVRRLSQSRARDDNDNDATKSEEADAEEYPHRLAPVKRRRLSSQQSVGSNSSGSTSGPVGPGPEKASNDQDMVAFSLATGAVATAVATAVAAAASCAASSASTAASQSPSQSTGPSVRRSDGLLSPTSSTSLAKTPTPTVCNSPQLPLPELSLAKEEKALVGAPDGELYVVTVLARNELQPITDLAKEIAQLHDIIAVKEIAAAESARTSVVSTPTSTSPAESAMVMNGKEKELEDISWAKEYAALDTVRRLACHHPSELLAVVDAALPALVLPAASNLRSAMARNALLCIQEIILCTKHDSLRFCDDLVPLLMQRMANEKQFIRDLAREVLDTCIHHCAGEELLRSLMRISETEKNPQVIGAAGVYTSMCVAKMPMDSLRTLVNEDHEGFFDDASVFMKCKVVECKAAMRRTLQRVRSACGEKEFIVLVKSRLQGVAQLDVLKASEPRKKPFVAKSGIPKLSMRERMMQHKKQQQLQRAASTSDGVESQNGGPCGDEIVISFSSSVQTKSPVASSESSSLR